MANVKAAPAYLADDYPITPVGEPIADFGSLSPVGVLYQLDCPACGAAVRTQGRNVARLVRRFQISGCPVCGKKDAFSVRRAELHK